MKMQNLKRFPRIRSILILVSLLCSSCTYFADGHLKRIVIFTVTDAKTTKVIPGADVRIAVPEHVQRLIEKKKQIRDNAEDEQKYEQVTGINGQAELLIWFGFGYKSTFGFKKGSFGLIGAGKVQVDTEGYETFESELSELAGEDHRSVNNKSPIEVHVKLIQSE